MSNNHINSTTIPLVEKYRPTKFENIVLDDINRKFFSNILSKCYFPNLLFYGPPGTGKTTTIINIINEFQNLYNKNAKGTVIHLNASDERGIDIIRNQINQFVKSKNLFEGGYKFVILDEVDYMTKNAQQALKYLLQTQICNVRFCLICNYISKIDESLQNEFICVRFNQLPKKDIFNFINNICINENIQMKDDNINTIINLYNSDIRSMINYIQLHLFSFNSNGVCTDECIQTPLCVNSFSRKEVCEAEKNIVNVKIWENIHDLLFSNSSECEIIDYINNVSIEYNIDKKNIIKQYFNHVIRNHGELLQPTFFEIIEKNIHNNEIPIQYIVKYFVYFVKEYYHKM
jgi:replication factor C subunit 3/5